MSRHCAQRGVIAEGARHRYRLARKHHGLVGVVGRLKSRRQAGEDLGTERRGDRRQGPVRLLEHGNQCGVDDPRHDLHPQRERSLGEKGRIVASTRDGRSLFAGLSCALVGRDARLRHAQQDQRPAPQPFERRRERHLLERGRKNRTCVLEGQRVERPLARVNRSFERSLRANDCYGREQMLCNLAERLSWCPRSFESGRHPSVESCTFVRREIAVERLSEERVRELVRGQHRLCHDSALQHDLERSTQSGLVAFANHRQERARELATNDRGRIEQAAGRAVERGQPLLDHLPQSLGNRKRRDRPF